MYRDAVSMFDSFRVWLSRNSHAARQMLHLKLTILDAPIGMTNIGSPRSMIFHDVADSGTLGFIRLPHVLLVVLRGPVSD